MTHLRFQLPNVILVVILHDLQKLRAAASTLCKSGETSGRPGVRARHWEHCRRRQSSRRGEVKHRQVYITCHPVHTAWRRGSLSGTPCADDKKGPDADALSVTSQALPLTWLLSPTLPRLSVRRATHCSPRRDPPPSQNIKSSHDVVRAPCLAKSQLSEAACACPRSIIFTAPLRHQGFAMADADDGWSTVDSTTKPRKTSSMNAG
jgi:hypothetical protein